MVYDLIVVGAGPAGLTAALYARRANKTVLLLEKDNFGGQITFSPKVENYPGFTQISGSALADHMVEQVLGQGVEVELCCVTGVKEKNGRNVVTTEDGSYEATAVILATGARHRMLGLPQEERFVGQGISFCAVCDGAFYQGKHVGMVGGGNSALQEALLLSDLAAHVTVIQNLHDFTGEERLARQLRERENVTILMDTVVSALHGGEQLQRVTLRSLTDNRETELELDGLFVAIGLLPQNDPFQHVIALDEYGYANSTEDCMTRTRGVFVAGDCRKKQVRQLTTAVGDGAVAALAACTYIDKQRKA